MQHFVDTLQGYLIKQIHMVLWQEFENELSNNVSVVDQLLMDD